ncbi:MAG: DUF4111 domain-containing protein [Bacillaceae bacterium]|nr:DUF4111 domain-containing protein [Bacillaceae bacterium]
MGFTWDACPSGIRKFVHDVLHDTKIITKDDMSGFYIHGSLAMGGFNPRRSDIDALVVTTTPLTVQQKRMLAGVFLRYSKQPYPLEVHFLHEKQLENWRHPCLYDFHYSEHWRNRYEKELMEGTHDYLNDEEKRDADLAAHITVINHRGVCVTGKPVQHVFPSVPRAHYISSIMNDFRDCLANIVQHPVYATLNMLRVYKYLKEGTISSKQEAGEWGLIELPSEYQSTIKKVMRSYTREKDDSFDTNALRELKDYLMKAVQKRVGEVNDA